MKRKTYCSSNSPDELVKLRDPKKRNIEWKKVLKIGEKYCVGKHCYLLFDIDGTTICLRKHDALHPDNKRTLRLNVTLTEDGKITYNASDNSVREVTYCPPPSVGATVLYRDELNTYLTCVVCEAMGTMLKIQPFGRNRFINVHMSSVLLYIYPKPLIQFKALKANYVDAAQLLGCKFSCEDESWSGKIVEFDSSTNLYLIKLDEPSGAPTDLRHNTANYYWLTLDYIFAMCRKEENAMQWNMDLDIELGTIVMKRPEHAKTLCCWNLWQFMHQCGDDDMLLSELNKFCLEIAAGEWSNCFSSREEFNILTSTLRMSCYFYHVCTKVCFEMVTPQSRYTNKDHLYRIIKNIEEQKNFVCKYGSREMYNARMKHYLSLVHPRNFEHYVKNRCSIPSEVIRRKISCGIVSINDTQMVLKIVYHGEPPAKSLTSYQKGNQDMYMRYIMHYFTYKPMNHCLYPPNYYIKNKQMEKWYTKLNSYEDSTLPLFDYQEILVKQMLYREEHEKAALSHCFEKVYKNVKYNLLSGTHRQTIPEFTGGILSADVGLGKTVMILSLYAHSKTKTLIVCPLSLIDQWRNEIQKFLPEEHVTDFHHKKKDLSGKLVLTTYGTILSAYRHGEYFSHFDRVVFDESHTIKDINSHTATACSAIAARKRWCVSATPISKNSFVSLKGQLKILRVAPFTEDECTMFKQESFVRDPKYFVKVLNCMWETIFFMQTRKEMHARGLLHHRQKYVEKVEYADGTLKEHNVLFESILRRMQEENGSISHTQLMHFKNAMLACIVDPCIVPMWMYGERLVEDTICRQTTEEITCSMGSSKYETEIKRVLKNIKDETCVICMEPFYRPTITECKHIFCNSCIMQHTQRQNNCPMCRTHLKDNTLVEISVNETTMESDLYGDMIVQNNLGHRYKVKKELYDLYTHRQEKQSFSPKMLEVLRIVNETKSSVIIFSSIRSVLKLLEKTFPDAGIITGNSSRVQRKKAIDRFQKKEIKVFILSTNCASVGITLTSGSHLIFMEPCIEDEVKEQAIGRLCRTGQMQDVVVHTMVARNLFDQKLLELKQKHDDFFEQFDENTAGATSMERLKKAYQKNLLVKLFT